MAETLLGYQQLQARFRAVGGVKFGPNMMKSLGIAANKEQRLLTRPNKKTGVTMASVGYSNVTATSVTTHAAAAARFLEYGTKPHIIRPRVARVLAWASGPAGGASRRLTGATRVGMSADHFAMIVHHPGTRPYPFMVPGARLAVSKAGLGNIIVQAWNSAA